MGSVDLEYGGLEHKSVKSTFVLYRRDLSVLPVPHINSSLYGFTFFRGKSFSCASGLALLFQIRSNIRLVLAIPSIFGSIPFLQNRLQLPVIHRMFKNRSRTHYDWRTDTNFSFGKQFLYRLPQARLCAEAVPERFCRGRLHRPNLFYGVCWHFL